MRKQPYKGLFFTIEGGEGCGKTTLAHFLVKELGKRGYDVVHTREPGGSPLSEHLRALLLNPPSGLKVGERSELLLFLAARAEHVDSLILPALKEGKIVICERFNDSTVAYQGCARYLGMTQVEELCYGIFADTEPDCTLLLDLDPALGMARARKRSVEGLDRVENEHIQFHREVRQGFLHLADKYPQRITILDAASPLEQVCEKAVVALESHLLLRPQKR